LNRSPSSCGTSAAGACRPNRMPHFADRASSLCGPRPRGGSLVLRGPSKDLNRSPSSCGTSTTGACRPNRMPHFADRASSLSGPRPRGGSLVLRGPSKDLNRSPSSCGTSTTGACRPNRKPEAGAEPHRATTLGSRHRPIPRVAVSAAATRRSPVGARSASAAFRSSLVRPSISFRSAFLPGFPVPWIRLLRTACPGASLPRFAMGPGSPAARG